VIIFLPLGYSTKLTLCSNSPTTKPSLISHHRCTHLDLKRTNFIDTDRRGNSFPLLPLNYCLADRTELIIPLMFVGCCLQTAIVQPPASRSPPSRRPVCCNVKEVSEEFIAPFIRVTRPCKLGTLVVTTRSNRCTLQRNTSVLTRATLRNITEDGIPLTYRRENLKSYIALTSLALNQRRNVSG
jgi:hypothetical protein